MRQIIKKFIGPIRIGASAGKTLLFIWIKNDLKNIQSKISKDKDPTLEICSRPRAKKNPSQGHLGVAPRAGSVRLGVGEGRATTDGRPTMYAL